MSRYGKVTLGELSPTLQEQIKQGSGNKTNVINNLTSTSATDALSAAQGKVLKELADSKASSNIATTSTNGLMSKEDKSKLDRVAADANNYVHPNDANTRHVTDTEKNTWNEKANNITVTTSTNGLMSKEDKSKLDGVAAGANNYVHPSNDGDKHIPANGTGNNGKFLQATATAGEYQWVNAPVPSDASVSVKGIVQLNDATNSTANNQAATANAAKKAYDRGTEALNKANEAFQFANNGKNTIATAIGSPLTSSDTFSAMGTKIDTLTQTFKDKLSEKGVVVNDSDKISNLVNKVSDISTSVTPTWVNPTETYSKLLKILGEFTDYTCYSELIGDYLYVFGAMGNTVMNEGFKINMSNGVVTNIPPIPRYRYRMSIISSGTNIYVYGGYKSYTGYNFLDCYDTISNTWSTKQSANYALENSIPAIHSNNIYYFGGYNTSSSNGTSATQCYDIISNTWSSKRSGASRFAGTACVIDSGVYVFSGYSGSYTSFTTYVNRYDIDSDTWSAKNNAPNPLAYSTCSTIDNKNIYLFGGRTNMGTNQSIYKHNILNDTYEEIGYFYNTEDGIDSAVYKGNIIITKRSDRNSVEVYLFIPKKEN